MLVLNFPTIGAKHFQTIKEIIGAKHFETIKEIIGAKHFETIKEIIGAKHFETRKEIIGAKYFHTHLVFIVTFLFWCGNCWSLLGQCTPVHYWSFEMKAIYSDHIIWSTVIKTVYSY